MKRKSGLLLSSIFLSVSVYSWGQLTIDATGPARPRSRITINSQGGGMGRKLPLQVSIAVQGASPHREGESVVEFVLTNTGKSAIEIPVSPNPGDFEPTDPDVGYSVDVLILRMNSTQGKQTQTLLGGAELYGNAALPGTLVQLAVGDSIQLLTLVQLPSSDNSHEPTSSVEFTAYAGLNHEVIKTIAGHNSSDMREIGYATSHTYTFPSLTKPPKLK